MKPDRLLEEIKSKIDIVEFISDYVQLKKSGQNLKGLCPFHSEKTPSFMVHPTKQIFHCFGCGVGGDIVSFLMKHDNLPFTEALSYLAKKAGIRISDIHYSKSSSEKREKILRINEETIKYFTGNLSSATSALTYLKNRGIKKESIEQFSIGYATDERDGLFRHLRKSGYPDSLLLDAGLVATDGKSFRDLFRGRIIFPIFNLSNDPVAFGGRVMGHSLPKYINSPETDLFKKSEILFAIHMAKDEIRKTGQALIVEGYLDAIICHQFGFRNAVAPLGTAMTAKHLHKLKVLTKNVVLVFDSDAAGIAAARRSLSIIFENDFKSKVLLLPAGEDPDSFLRKNGSSPFQKMLSEAITPVDFFLKTSKNERRVTIREILTMIAGMHDLILADEIIGELADRSGTHESVLRSELEKSKSRSASQPVKRGVPSKKRPDHTEDLLLSAIIAFPEKRELLLSKLDIENDIRDSTVKSVFHKIMMMQDSFTINSLLDKADDAEKALITELSLNPGFDPEEVDRNIHDCIRRITQRQFDEKRLAALSQEPDDVALHNLLLKEKRKLIRGAHP
jgi:DNA primase